MKTIFLIFTLCCTHYYFLPISAQASNATLQVLDGKGNAVEAGSAYYIRPANDTRRGGVALAHTGAQRCPLTVIQQKVNVQNGIRVTFHSSNPLDKTIPVSSNINIKFNASIHCANSTVWHTAQQYVEINGILGDASCGSATSWFKIIPGTGSGNSYKIVSNTHWLCPNAPDKDSYIGVTVSAGGVRPLIVPVANAYEVKFWKHN